MRCASSELEPIQSRVKEYMVGVSGAGTLMVRHLRALDLVLFTVFEGGPDPMF